MILMIVMVLRESERTMRSEIWVWVVLDTGPTTQPTSSTGSLRRCPSSSRVQVSALPESPGYELKVHSDTRQEQRTWYLPVILPCYHTDTKLLPVSTTDHPLFFLLLISSSSRIWIVLMTSGWQPDDDPTVTDLRITCKHIKPSVQTPPLPLLPSFAPSFLLPSFLDLTFEWFRLGIDIHAISWEYRTNQNQKPKTKIKTNHWPQTSKLNTTHTNRQVISKDNKNRTSTTANVESSSELGPLSQQLRYALTGTTYLRNRAKRGDTVWFVVGGLGGSEAWPSKVQRGEISVRHVRSHVQYVHAKRKLNLRAPNLHSTVLPTTIRRNKTRFTRWWWMWRRRPLRHAMRRYSATTPNS